MAACLREPVNILEPLLLLIASCIRGNFLDPLLPWPHLAVAVFIVVAVQDILSCRGWFSSGWLTFWSVMFGRGTDSGRIFSVSRQQAPNARLGRAVSETGSLVYQPCFRYGFFRARRPENPSPAQCAGSRLFFQIRKIKCSAFLAPVNLGVLAKGLFHFIAKIVPTL